MPEVTKITLSYKNIELILLPDLGGRIVSAKYNECQSVLKTDENDWDGKNKPALDGESDFYAFNGHINWVGPQSAWWTKQDINAERKENASPWPPDPYLIYGEYKITHQSERSIVLEGPASPISGIRFIKEIGINEDESVFLKTRMENTSLEIQEWDIWFNTRMDGYSNMYVPITGKAEDCRVEHVLNDQSDKMPSTQSAGFFSYLPIPPDEKYNERSSKSYIYPEQPYMAAFTKDSLIIYQFEKHPLESIHPEQALVEIYNHTEAEKNNALLEMEYHSPIFKLSPGESAEAFQIWHILPYAGEDSRLEHVEYLTSAVEELGL